MCVDEDNRQVGLQVELSREDGFQLQVHVMGQREVNVIIHCLII